MNHGGATNVHGFPSEPGIPEGHYYVFAHVNAALDLMLDVLLHENTHGRTAHEAIIAAREGAAAALKAAGGGDDDGFGGIVDPETAPAGPAIEL